MRKRLPFLFVTGALLTGASACAMTAPAAPQVACTVEGSKHLPPETGGETALCGAIRQAVSDAGHSSARVQVIVRSPSQVSATVTLADGRSLPAVTTATADRNLSSRSVRMLADAISAQLRSVRP